MLPIQPLFSQFLDLDGSPLDDGRVWFGQPDQNPETAPIVAYWDADGTQPVAQPLRIKNGFPVYRGAAAQVHVAGDHSCTIKDRKGRLVAYRPRAEMLAAINQARIDLDAAQTAQARALQAFTGGQDRGDWSPNTLYQAGQIVWVGNVGYQAKQDHTSGATFAADLAAGKWVVFQGVTRGELSAAEGAGIVGFQQLGAGAVQRTMLDKARDFFSSRDYLTPADGYAESIRRAIGATTADVVQRGALYLPPGDQGDVTGEILIHRKSITINGQNASLKWVGTNPNESIFKITDSSRVKLCDMVLLGDLSSPPLAAVRFFRNTTGDTKGTNESCTIENISIGRKFGSDTITGGSADAAPYGKVQNGILVDGADGNNDEIIISNVQIHGASAIAIDFKNTQSIWSHIRDSVVNDSAVGYRLGCNMQMTNVRANRITVADIVGIRQTKCWINGFNAENSTQFIQSNAGASFYVDGGKLLRNSATASNFFRVNAGGDLFLRNMEVANPGGSGDTIYYRSGSLGDNRIVVDKCVIQGGNLRDTWDIEVWASSGKESLIDISQGKLRWKTTGPYFDRQIAAASISAGSSVAVSSGPGVITPMGDLWHVAYQYDLQGQHITHCPDSAGQIRARVFNVAADAITLGAGRYRWMNLRDWLMATATANINAPLMANNAGHSAAITLPGVQLGDFIGWGAASGYTNSVVTAYVSAANTVTVRIHNASGGNSDPADTSFTVGKLKERGNFQNTLAYAPTPIANAATVTLTCTVADAQVGAHVLIAYTNDLQGLICTAYVSAANTVTIVLTNYTGGSITLGAGHFKVMVAF